MSNSRNRSRRGPGAARVEEIPGGTKQMMAHRHVPIGVARRLSLVPAGAGVRARSFSAVSPRAQVIGDSSDDLVSKAFLEELPRPAQAQASNGITSIPVDEAPGHGIEPLLELMTERVELRRVMSRPVHQGDFFGSRPPQRDDREGDLVSLHGRRPPVRSRPSVPLHDPVALPHSSVQPAAKSGFRFPSSSDSAKLLCRNCWQLRRPSWKSWARKS